MTDEEKQIWRAAYAAAFVEDFSRLYSHSDKFDLSLSRTGAEAAATVADVAVYRLRMWRRDEEPEMGTEIDSASIAKWYDDNA